MMLKASLNKQDFVLGLEENAMDSLVHAVEYFLSDERDTDLKYTVLHVFHAAELFLKARLAKNSEELIYEKPKKDGTRNTIGFDKAIERLQQRGVRLSERDCSNLNLLRQIRNNIEHYKIIGSRDEIEEFVGRAVDFLDTFVNEELGLSLKKELDELDESGETYRTLSMALFFYVKRMVEAGIPLYSIYHPKYKNQDYQFFVCEQCDEEAIAFPDPTAKDGTIHCFHCWASYSVGYCPRCDRPILSLIGSWELAVESTSSSSSSFDNSEEESSWRFCDRCQEQIDEFD
jgi:hypothetical protein